MADDELNEAIRLSLATADEEVHYPLNFLMRGENRQTIIVDQANPVVRHVLFFFVFEQRNNFCKV